MRLERDDHPTYLGLGEPVSESNESLVESLSGLTDYQLKQAS